MWSVSNFLIIFINLMWQLYCVLVWHKINKRAGFFYCLFLYVAFYFLLLSLSLPLSSDTPHIESSSTGFCSIVWLNCFLHLRVFMLLSRILSKLYLWRMKKKRISKIWSISEGPKVFYLRIQILCYPCQEGIERNFWRYLKTKIQK